MCVSFIYIIIFVVLLVLLFFGDTTNTRDTRIIAMKKHIKHREALKKYYHKNEEYRKNKNKRDNENHKRLYHTDPLFRANMKDYHTGEATQKDCYAVDIYGN